MGRLTVHTLFSGNTAVVIAQGELDIRTAPGLRRALTEVLDQRPHRLILDLAGVTFIDCAAARVLAAASRALPGSREALIRRPGRPVQRVLALTGMSACFQFEHSRRSSIRAGHHAAGASGARIAASRRLRHPR